MQVKGKIWQSDGFWILEIKNLDLLTEAKTKTVAVNNFLSLIEEKYSFKKEHFSISIVESEFFLEAVEQKYLVPLVLKGLRNAQNLTISDVAKRLGFQGRSSYSKYESGTRSISIDNFEKVVSAITGKKIIFSLEK